MNYSEGLEYMAKTILVEAGGESLTGQVAVGWTIRNRTVERNQTVREVVLAPLQFSAWNASPDNVKLLRRLATCDLDHTPGLLKACGVAALVLSGDFPDPTNGATHYHTVQAPAGAALWPPRWALAPSMEFLVEIGNHRFYKEH